MLSKTIHRTASNRVLALIALAAVILRIAAALYQGNAVEPLPGIADQVSYHTLAMRVLEGHGFSFETGWWPATAAGEPTAHWSFLYVLFLAGTYTVFGPSPLAARLIQALAAGVLQSWLTFRIGNRLFSRRVGLIAAVLACCNGYFVFYSGALMTESLYIVAMLWIVDLCTVMTVRSAARGPQSTAGTWALLGIAMGAAVLLRQVALLLVPAILAWLVWHAVRRGVAQGNPRGRQLVQAAKRAAVACAVIVLLILPWTVRNYRAFHEFVLLNTNAGFAFFWANHPVHGSEFLPLLPEGGPTYGDLIPTELRPLNEAALDRALLSRGLGFAWSDPARYLRLSVSRMREYFKFWPSASSGSVSNYVRILSFGIYVPFLAAGVAMVLFGLGRANGFGDRARRARFFVLLVAALYTLIHLLSWALIRYRLPIDAITLPFTAAAMALFYDRLAVLFRPAGIIQHPDVP